jgi:hypothetical protein
MFEAPEFPVRYQTVIYLLSAVAIFYYARRLKKKRIKTSHPD